MTQEIVIEHQPTKNVTNEADKEKLKLKKSTQKHFEWLNDLNQQVRGETALWVAVITQAMMDALSQAKSSEARYHKHEAINWLTGNSRNFITVCHFAGLDPDYIRRKAKRALIAPQLWRAEAGKGKRYLERKAYRKRQKARKIPADEPAAQMVITGHWNQSLNA